MKNTTGHMIKTDGWMAYRLHIDGEDKPRRVYWRNHGKSYIQYGRDWVRVYFNQYVMDDGKFESIPMLLVDGEWEMSCMYEQLPGSGTSYSIVGNS